MFPLQRGAMNDQIVGRIDPGVDVIDRRSSAGTPGGGQDDANRDDTPQTWPHFLRPLCFETRSAGQLVINLRPAQDSLPRWRATGRWLLGAGYQLARQKG